MNNIFDVKVAGKTVEFSESKQLALEAYDNSTNSNKEIYILDVSMQHKHLVSPDVLRGTI